jgi:alpha-D-ribose 1-methylphosphonate 5-triphosphate diphosphatase
MTRQRAVSEPTVVVENGRVVTPTDVVEGAVRVEGDRIVDVGDVARNADEVIDARGRFVVPGLVDLHGDDIESQLHPRSGARMDTHMALAAADRANVAAGITTKFHAISFEIDPDENRSPELGAEITAAVDDADDLMADHRIHARCEVTQEVCVDAVTDIVDAGDASLVSVMSHIPGKGQFSDEDAFLDYYRRSQNHSLEEAREMIEARGGLELETIRERVNRVVSAANAHDVPTASHDDDDAEEVERLDDLGVDISEYPITLETAERAHELGMTVTMGAPNLVRGESQWGNLRTADAVDAGVVDALVADYHPPSLLAATFVDTDEPLPTRVARVTKNPADAVGFDDRGRIESGARADLVVVDPDPTPTVARALVGGKPVYRADTQVSGGVR